MGTVATIRLANPVSINFSEIVTPPFPPRRRHAPTMSDVFQSSQVDLSGPCRRAIANIMRPARKKKLVWRNPINERWRSTTGKKPKKPPTPSGTRTSYCSPLLLTSIPVPSNEANSGYRASWRVGSPRLRGRPPGTTRSRNEARPAVSRRGGTPDLRRGHRPDRGRPRGAPRGGRSHAFQGALRRPRPDSSRRRPHQ